MKFNSKVFNSIIYSCLLIVLQTAFCSVRLPKLVSDGMVLQRDTKVKVWGWADANEKITINFIGKTYKTTAAADGKWTVPLGSLKAGGSYDMEIQGNNKITIKNILIGDVWVCSGQSNMELTMERAKYKYPDVIAKCENPNIRQFEVPDRYVFESPQDDDFPTTFER